MYTSYIRNCFYHKLKKKSVEILMINALKYGKDHLNFDISLVNRYFPPKDVLGIGLSEDLIWPK